jgi:hypothetical protein
MSPSLKCWPMLGAYRKVLLQDPCVYCGKPAEVLDHIWPRSRGGGDGWENRAPTCKGCDEVKRNASVVVFMLAGELAWRRVARRKRYQSQIARNAALASIRAKIAEEFYCGNIRVSGGADTR